MKQTRNTPAKTEIVRLLNHSSIALSHSEIQQQLNGLCDRVTIYRVLDRLLFEGSVHKIVNVDGVVKYAMCHTCSSPEHHQHTHNHVHFSCNSCKAVTCIENIHPNISLPASYQVQEMNITISGVCPECN